MWISLQPTIIRSSYSLWQQAENDNLCLWWLILHGTIWSLVWIEMKQRARPCLWRVYKLSMIRMCSCSGEGGCGGMEDVEPNADSASQIKQTRPEIRTNDWATSFYPDTEHISVYNSANTWLVRVQVNVSEHSHLFCCLGMRTEPSRKPLKSMLLAWKVINLLAFIQDVKSKCYHFK